MKASRPGCRTGFSTGLLNLDNCSCKGLVKIWRLGLEARGWVESSRFFTTDGSKFGLFSKLKLLPRVLLLGLCPSCGLMHDPSSLLEKIAV